MDRTLGWTTPMVVTKYLCAVYIIGTCLAVMTFGISLPIMFFFTVTLVCLLCAQASPEAQPSLHADAIAAPKVAASYCQNAHCPCETHHNPMVYTEGEYEYGSGVWQPASCQNSECSCAYHQRAEVFFNGNAWAIRDGSLWSGYCYDRHCFCSQHKQSRRFDITERQWLFKEPCYDELCACWWHRSPNQQFSEGHWQQCP